MTTEEFNEIITENQQVLIDFYATWCGPCRAMSTTIDDFAKTHKDIKVLKCDVEENEELAQMFGVKNLPFIAYIKNGELVDSRVGLQNMNNLIDLVK